MLVELRDSSGLSIYIDRSEIAPYWESERPGTAPYWERDG